MKGTVTGAVVGTNVGREFTGTRVVGSLLAPESEERLTEAWSPVTI